MGGIAGGIRRINGAHRRENRFNSTGEGDASSTFEKVQRGEYNATDARCLDSERWSDLASLFVVVVTLIILSLNESNCSIKL